MHYRHTRYILLTLTILTVLTTLYFGLRFKGYRPENNVSRLQDEPGIHFKRFGIAYEKLNNAEKFSSLKNFTFEIALKPDRAKTYGFDLIMTVHGGSDSDQLIIGQWQSYVVIMNGDDYSHKRKIKRVSADIFNKPFKKMLLTAVTGEKGTELFINGELIKSSPDLALLIPGGKKTILTLGNSVYGNTSWSGNIYGFALYDHQLPYEAIEGHFKTWEEGRSFSVFNEEKPLLLFDFSKNDKLIIPEHFVVLKKRFLSFSWNNMAMDRNTFSDLMINFFGFIPLGFLLSAFLISQSEIPDKRILMISAAACFLISLFIEITQAWIPSRSSQLIDLILNTLGGYVGALASIKLTRKFGAGMPGS